MPDSLSSRLAALEGAESALVLASGRAAVSCTALALLRSGDHLLASDAIRDTTRQFFEREVPALGVEVSYVDARDTRGWRTGVRQATRALFVEAPVLESGRVIDLRPPRTLAHELGMVLIVDATAASPINFTPLAHGADVVLHDATWMLAPDGEGEAGIVAGTEGLVEEVRRKMDAWGAVPHPHAHRHLERALATLEVRVHRQNATACAVAEWAGRQPAVAAVQWAGLPSHPDHELLAAWFRGPGAMVHIRLHEASEAQRFAARASALLAPHHGGRHGVSEVRLGTDRAWVRIMVGLEPAETVIGALSTALTTTSGLG